MPSAIPLHPRLEPALALGGLMASAAECAAAAALHAFRRHRWYAARRPGAATPLWNACASLLAQQLSRRGAKARLARALGIPRQRLNDFLRGRTRLPDAELTLELLAWLAAKRSGDDRSY